MPSIEQVKKICIANYQVAATSVPILIGAPGMGKSFACDQIAVGLGIPKNRVLSVHVNNFDVVDFTGVPSVVDGTTIFNPTKMFYDFREGTGEGLIIIEELPQAHSIGLQTWAAGFIWDRCTPTYVLDPEVKIIVTGNRKEDRAGAKPMLSHLEDRLDEYQVETSLDDWCVWAIENNVNTKLIAFLRLQPELLNDFDPQRSCNPTQRSWTKLSREVNEDLPIDLYLYACQAKVGKAAASAWVGAKDLMDKMPSIDVVRMHPDKTEVPKEAAVRHAITVALSTTVEDANGFERDMKYIKRMLKMFQVVYVTDVLRRIPDAATTKTFIDWSIENKDIFMGGN